MVFDDLRQYIEACKEVGDWKVIDGADWNLEIGALTEAAAELIPQPPMLLFDRIKGYPPGYRVVSLLFAAYKRGALALDLPPEKSKIELIRLAARKIKSAKPVPPKEIEAEKAPVMENRLRDEDVDLL